ncbi:hypothetical protein AA309_15025 [Microvirga vignae]|uniref:Carrier domain-containing protein n=1 Tax=Microvirga vignae TaxID=1225564 RepID=A0A0H1RB90_9HYPH|nr:acyl carrier protein [Microvirga vignae]KLK92299.1 hypothetical protein AA309_15025 [Microvirga vignae]
MTFDSEANVARQIADLCQWISEGSIAHIEMSMSLTRDLAFDSMKLMQFFAGTEELYSGIALEDWFIEHSAGGRDTIGSVVQYIAAALIPMAAERSNGSRRNNHSRDLGQSIQSRSQTRL